ncbi:MAG: hypothetical protein QMB24_04580 [Spirosomataceae bacterium]
MKYLIVISLICVTFFASAQHSLHVPVDTTIITKHSANINGESFPYTATTGFQPVWDENGKPIA